MWQEKKKTEERTYYLQSGIFRYRIQNYGKGLEQYTLEGLIDPSKNFVDCKDLYLGDKNMFVGEING